MQTGLVCLYFPSAGLQLRLPSSLPPRPSVLFFSSFFLSLCFLGGWAEGKILLCTAQVGLKLSAVLLLQLPGC